jgi:radial spoke head protein 9
MAIAQLLNNAQPTDFDELMFWGRISGVKADYYIAMGICYNDRFEFPEKKYYWCSSSNNMIFEAFPAINDQHKDKYDGFANQLFTGEPKKILIKVEPDEGAQVAEVEKKVQGDLSSTEEIDPESLIVRINLKEIDRLHYHVRAIENDCHIIPQGSMKLTLAHEVQRNEAFRGLPPSECFNLTYYSHFRNVQDQAKKENLEADDAIFQRDFLDEVISDQPTGCWAL